MPTKYHMAIDVKGVLTNWSTKDMQGMFKDDNGRLLSGAESKELLLDELSKGHNFLPVGSCDNFDHKEHGCMGHPAE